MNLRQACSTQALFIERAQALLHGDIHTGSFMVTQDTTYAIDAEFAYYGPIAFDVSKMIANLLIAFFASQGLESADKRRDEQRAWMLQVSWASSAPVCTASSASSCCKCKQDDRRPAYSFFLRLARPGKR